MQDSPSRPLKWFLQAESLTCSSIQEVGGEHDVGGAEVPARHRHKPPSRLYISRRGLRPAFISVPRTHCIHVPLHVTGVFLRLADVTAWWAESGVVFNSRFPAKSLPGEFPEKLLSTSGSRDHLSVCVCV